jgi:Hg(II)-responsive transcriptional regulator
MALTIGQVATAADVNIQTIRYYERRGLFPAPRRTAAGYRQYADDAVARLRFIKHAQALGFSLEEIADLLGLRVRHGAACDAVERKTRQKIVVVQQRIRDLQRMKRILERLASACTARQPTDDCPILEVLEDHGIVSH